MEDITARTPIVRAPSDHFDAYNEGINHGEEDSEWAQQVKIKRCGKRIAFRLKKQFYCLSILVQIITEDIYIEDPIFPSSD